MYTQLRENLAGTPSRPHAAENQRGATRLNRNVVLLGLTSLFTDISSEMVSAVLPLYFIVHLKLTPLHFGVLDGVYQGAAALVRIAGGILADRRGRHKEVAAVGYGLSAVCKLGLLAVGGAWGALAAVIVLDRTGKGIRSAPRDALISLSVPPARLGAAFGLHRTLDTTGALLGPLIAFAILSLSAVAFDAVFVVSFCAALIGLAILVLFVDNRPERAGGVTVPAPPAVRRAALPSLSSTVKLLAERRFRTLVLAGSGLGLFTISDGFLYLTLQRRLDLSIGFFPLLYVATAAVYLLLAIPAGRLADRIGRGKVFAGGYLLILGVYIALLRGSFGMAELALYVVLLGAFYAATDGVLMALAGEVLPRELRASGMALLTTGAGLSKLVGSIMFGAMWTWQGNDTAVLVLTAGLITVAGTALITLARGERQRQHDHSPTGI